MQYFLAVAEELHFGRAANRLHMSQPPLSQQIQKLESELGTPLFIRTSRNVCLTEEGKVFLTETRKILNQVEHGIQTLKQASGGFAGKICIGFNEAAIDSFLSSAVRTFRERYPKIELTLCEMESYEQLEALRNMQIDIAFPRLFHQDLQGLDYRILQREKYCIAINSRHKLAKMKKIMLSSLKKEPLIIVSQKINQILHNWILSVCHNSNYFPEEIQEANSKSTTLALVEAGMGVAFVPELFRKIKRENVSYIQVSAKLPDVELATVWRKEYHPAVVENFLACASESAANDLP